jgi:hypothetical protein
MFDPISSVNFIFLFVYYIHVKLVAKSVENKMLFFL